MMPGLSCASAAGRYSSLQGARPRTLWRGKDC